MILTLVSTGISPGALLTTPCSTEELARLQEFLSAQRAQKRKRPEGGALPDNGGNNERDDTGNGNNNNNNNIDADACVSFHSMWSHTRLR